MAAVFKSVKKRTDHRCLGTSTLEAALVLVLLLVITLGIMGFGWLFLRVQQVTNASRQGARTAIRYGATTGEVEGAVDGLLSGVNLTYKDLAITDDIDPNIGEAVTVTVTGTGLDLLNLGSGGMLSIPIPDEFTSSTTMAKEGP